MAMDALDLGGTVEALRIFAEKKDCGIGRSFVVEQVDVGKQGRCGGVRLEWKTASPMSHLGIIWSIKIKYS